jgi:hypothetical protein
VFVGEIVEKGTASVSDLHIQANIPQHGRYKNAEETVALYHQTIYEKHTGCIKNKLDELEPPGHCVQNDCLSGKMLSSHFGALITPMGDWLSPEVSLAVPTDRHILIYSILPSFSQTLFTTNTYRWCSPSLPCIVFCSWWTTFFLKFKWSALPPRSYISNNCFGPQLLARLEVLLVSGVNATRSCAKSSRVFSSRNRSPIITG